MLQQRSIPAQGFPRRKRLTQPEDFAKALKQRALVRNPRFALYVFEPEQNAADAANVQMPDVQTHQVAESSVWRLGLIVPKRYEASAVRRNAIKRIWREAFRRRSELLDLPGRGLVARLLSAIAPDQSLALLKRQCHEDAEILLQQMTVKLQTQGGISVRS